MSVLLTQAPSKLFESGTVGIIPTDTVYGIVARAADQAAVSRLYSLKQREHKPGTLIAASIEQLVELGLKRRYLVAVQQFWPAALSVIIPCEPALAYLDLGKQAVAVRINGNAELMGLLQQTGPLVTTSANPPGQPTATTLKQAQDYFAQSVDFYVDGGDLSGSKPSTIIRIVDDAIEVIRPGAVAIHS